MQRCTDVIRTQTLLFYNYVPYCTMYINQKLQDFTYNVFIPAICIVCQVILHNPPVLNCRCRLMQVDLYNGHKMVVVVLCFH